MSAIVVASRFNGPPRSGNGGYTCGLVAQQVGHAAVVTLRSPPPLERALTIEHVGDGVRVVDGPTVVAEASPSDAALDVPDPVLYEQALAVSAPPDGHPFPTCFVCGPLRAPGDGLRLFVGPVGDGVTAAPWVPDASLRSADGLVASEFVWAALDCPGGWSAERDVALLGRLDARVYSRPKAGERCAVAAWPIGTRSGRKWVAGTALFGEGGMLHAAARSTWIVPRPAA